MNNMNIRIYYNHLYDDYKKYCFLLYIEGLGIFVSTTNDLFTSIEKPDVVIDNEIIGTNYTFEELIKNYKSDFLNNKIYSSATILFCSNAFSQIFDYISEPKPQAPVVTEKVGRNDPCPCGSGKKFKNCCGK